MPTHGRRWTLRDMALFVAIAAIVAVVGVVVGRELGSSGQAAATLEEAIVDTSVTEATATSDVPDEAQGANPDASEPVAGIDRDSEEPARSQATASDLSLTLSAPDICETDYGFQGWGLGETPVTWKVTDGKGPYTLEIDGETRDGSGPYIGPTGTASVSCALQTGEVHYEHRSKQPYRDLRGAYVIDSGLKTIRAVVTDAEGKTGEATVAVYVILSTGRHEHLLRRGQTYRVFGKLLLTIPPDVDFRIGETSSDGTFSLTVNGSDYSAVIWLDEDTFIEIRRFLPESGELAIGVAAEDTDLDETFDKLVDSFGQHPQSAKTSVE